MSQIFQKMIIDFPDESESICMEHCLEGYAFLRDSRRFNGFKSAWMHEHLNNSLKEKEVQDLGLKFKDHNIKVVLLKGMALINTIYADLGARSMGDVDLLVDFKNVEKVQAIFLEQGFVPVKTSKWRANHFKSIFEKRVEDRMVIIELHSQLFYAENKRAINWKTIPCEYEGFCKLDYSDFFIHLCGHLAHQHTFLFLHWLIDIELFFTLCKDELDWVYILKTTKELNHKVSLCSVLYCLDAFTGLSLPQAAIDFNNQYLPSKLKELLSFEFLCFPHNDKFLYYRIKHLLKDSWKEAFSYNIYWLGDKLREKLARD